MDRKMKNGSEEKRRRERKKNSNSIKDRNSDAQKQIIKMYTHIDKEKRKGRKKNRG